MGSTTSTHRATTMSKTSQVDTKMVQGFRVFEISGYRQLLQRHGAGGRSPVFTVGGGYHWQIECYDGGAEIIESLKDFVVVRVHLRNKKNDTCRVVASVQLSLVDVTGSSSHHTVTTEFDSGGNKRFSDPLRFIKMSELERSPYPHDDRLTMACLVTILKESNNAADTVKKFVEMPPSNITEHLGKLLRGGEGTDVVFVVGRDDFPAHKTVLAMRSPVFKAELYGEMRENDTNRITIGDMQPAVFEALIHFIYTDSLSPDMDRLGGDDYKDMVRHLLVAADRYAMERLKFICESLLCETLDVKTVMTTLALADQHHCGRLKDDSIKFIASLGAKEIDGVMASEGYVEPKATSPLALEQLQPSPESPPGPSF